MCWYTTIAYKQINTIFCMMYYCKMVSLELYKDRQSKSVYLQIHKNSLVYHNSIQKNKYNICMMFYCEMVSLALYKDTTKQTISCHTYKWKVSLNLGDQLLLFDFVECFRFLSLRCGPIRCTSMKGRNMLVVCHLRSLAATTSESKTEKVQVDQR